MYKNKYIYKYEKLDIINSYKYFFKKIKKFKLYIIKFEDNNIIKSKLCIFNYIVEEIKY